MAYSKRDFLIEKRKKSRQFAYLTNGIIVTSYLIVAIIIAVFNKDTTVLDLLFVEILLFAFTLEHTYRLLKKYILKIDIKNDFENIERQIEIFKQHKAVRDNEYFVTNIILNSVFFVFLSAFFLFNQSYHLCIENHVNEKELKIIKGTAKVNNQCGTFGHSLLDLIADRVICHKHHAQEPFSINGFNLYAGSDFYEKHSNKIDNQKITVLYKNEKMSIGNPFFMFATPLAIVQNEKVEKPVVYEIRDEFDNVILSESYFTEQYKKQRNNYWTILAILSIVTLICVAANIYANLKFIENNIPIKSICES